MSFVFVVSDARGAPARRWLPAAEAALPFAAGERLRFAAGGFEVHAWPAREAAEGFERWHDDGAAAACFGGYGIGADGELMTARALAASADAAEARARFHGEWAAVVRRPDGRIWAGSAAGGGGHLYAAAEGPAMLANHARPLWSALRALGRPPSPDWRALSWLITAGWVPEVRRTAVTGVELVPASEAVEIDPEAARVRRRGLGEIELPADPSAAPPPTDWRALADRVVGNLAWARRGDGDHVVGLTGGKDSRLVAAAIRSVGLSGRCRFYTVGEPRQPDVEVARRVAASLGSGCELRPPAAVPDLPTALRRHVALTEGMIGAFDLKGLEVPAPAISIHGLFGEVYRRSRREVAAGARDFARTRAGAGNDLFGLLQPEWRQVQEDRLTRWLERLLEQGLPIELAEETFYLNVRYPRWASPAQQSESRRAPAINPLLHPDLLAAYLRLPIEDRWLERLHYELLARLAPDLLSIPFADRTWRDGLERRTGLAARLPREVVTGGGSWLGIGWQVPALRRQWPLLRSWILDRAGELAPLTRRDSLELHLDLAETAIAGRPTRRSLRRGLRRPRLLRAVRGRPRAAIAATLCLLTLLALLDDLKETPDPARRADD